MIPPGAASVTNMTKDFQDSITLDDGLSSQNPEEVEFPTGGLTYNNTVRVGDTVNDIVAPVWYAYSRWRLPVDAVRHQCTSGSMSLYAAPAVCDDPSAS